MSAVCRYDNSTINNIIMKIRHLLIGMLAIAAAVACKEDEPLEEPKLDVDKTAVSVAATAGEATFNVTSNQSWVTYVDQDWVSLEPASGSASEKAVAVKVTAEDNEATEAREATVTVKAGELTKTVKVTQAAATETPGPGPELPLSEWALVGSFNNWDPASDVYLSVLDEEYFVYYGFEMDETTEFKFLKGGVWPPEGQEIGGNGLVEPNTIQPAGGSNIKATEAGKYDIYLAADLTKFYIMSEGKLPAEATEPAPVENSWGMMGCFVDNQWATDVPMTKEGEWIVAKGAQFTELTFKIRANSSWADATNIGMAPGSEKGAVNSKVSVVTAEYAKANLGGDAADIKLDGEAGTYDVYFSFENLEVYVMTPGSKPGEAPVGPETVELTTFLGFTSNVASGTNSVTVQLAPAGSVYMESVTSEHGTWEQMAGEGKYLKFDVYSADGTLAAGTYTPCEVAGTITEGTFGIGWDPGDLWGIGMVFENWGTCWMTHNADGTETGVKVTDGTITVAVDGDVYTITVESSVLNATYTGKLSKDTTGGQEPDPQPSAWALVGDFNGWDAAGSTYFLTELDSEYFVYYGFEAAAGLQFKFVKDGKWASQGGAEIGGEIGTAEPNTIQPAGGKNIVIAEAGKYDIYLASDLSKFYVMTEGKLPAEATEPAPVEVTYTVVGTLNGINWNNSAPEGLMTKEGDYYVAKNVPFVWASTLYNGAEQFEFKIVETATWNGYGVAEQGAPASPANTEITLVENGQNIPVTAAEGNYDVYFDKENAKVWVMNPGLKPGEQPVEYTLDGKQWLFNTYYIIVDLGVHQEDMMVIAAPMEDGSGFAPMMYGTYEIRKETATSGKVIFNQYDEASGEYLAALEFPYSDLSESVVYISAEPLLGDPTPMPFVALDQPYEIMFPEPEPAGPKVVTVAEFLAAPEDDTEYQLTGVIEGTYNTTYGNFYLVDDSGKVLVYGLTATPKTSNDKSFASLGLRDGDTLTLVGKRDSYNGTAQVGGPAYYVSHISAPFLALAQESATVNHDATSYTIKVESNLDWMVVPSGTVTPDKTSGSGNGEVVISFAANETDTPVDHLVVFMAGSITKTFTLTQKAVPAAGEVVIFEETFAGCTGTMGWSGDVANGTFKTDNEGWTTVKSYGAGGAAKFGTSSVQGTAETPALELTGDATLTFKAGAWNSSSESTTLKLSMTGGTLSVATVTLTKGDWTEYEVTITGATSGAKIKFTANQASKSRFLLDDVKVIQAQ